MSREDISPISDFLVTKAPTWRAWGKNAFIALVLLPAGKTTVHSFAEWVGGSASVADIAGWGYLLLMSGLILGHEMGKRDHHRALVKALADQSVTTASLSTSEVNRTGSEPAPASKDESGHLLQPQTA